MLSALCTSVRTSVYPPEKPRSLVTLLPEKGRVNETNKKNWLPKDGQEERKKEEKEELGGLWCGNGVPGSGDAPGNGRTYPGWGQKDPCPPLASRRLYFILYHKGRRAAKSSSCGDFLFLFLPFATAPSAAVCWSCSSAAVAAAVHDRLSSATAPVPCCKSFAQHPFVAKEAALCFVCGKLARENKSTAIFSSVVVSPLLLVLLVLYTVIVGCPLSFSLLHLFFPLFCLAGSSKSVCIVHIRRRRTCCNLQARFGV